MKPTVTKDELTELETRVLWQLDYGFSTAILLKTLCDRVHVKEERKVRLAIESLRGKLWPILSGDTGYYLCKTREEMESFIAYHRKEVIARCIMMRNIKRGCNERLGKQVQIKMI